jgi:hypothetical protein
MNLMHRYRPTQYIGSIAHKFLDTACKPSMSLVQLLAQDSRMNKKYKKDKQLLDFGLAASS